MYPVYSKHSPILTIYPKMGVSPNHPFLDWDFPRNKPSTTWGYLLYGTPQILAIDSPQVTGRGAKSRRIVRRPRDRRRGRARRFYLGRWGAGKA